MEPEGSLPCSQQPATGRYPEPDASSPHLATHFPKIHSNITFPSTPRSYNDFFPSGFPTKIVYVILISPMRATCLSFHA
jgi:hypothetical protein